MTSPTLSSEPIRFSRALLWVNIKRFIWLPLLDLLGMLLFLPFVILSSGPSQAQRILENKVQLESWGGQNWFIDLTHGNPLLTLLMIATALLWAALLYSYLNDGKAVTMFHSLPFSRKQLFWNLNFAGAAGMLFPVLITAFCCLVLRYFGSIGILYSAGDVLQWAVGYFILEMVFFASAVFTGMFTGMPLVQPIFALILQGLPAVLYGLTVLCLHEGIYGFPRYADHMEWAEQLPIIKIFNSWNNPYSLTYLLAMILLTAAFLLAGLWVYRRRPLERTGDIIVFPALNPVFKYGMTYCACLSGALMTAALINQSLTWWMLLLWAFVGYCLAEMLIQKTARILNAWPGILAYALLMILLIAGIKTDITGYQRRLPQADQVAAVIVNSGEETYDGIKALEALEAQGERVQPQMVDRIDPRLCFQAPANIEAMLQVHQQLIGLRSVEVMEKSRNNELTYIMKDGSIMKRQYKLNLADYPVQAKQLYESEEYKKNRRNISYAQAEDLMWLKLSNNSRQGAQAEVVGMQEMDGLLAAIQQDLKEESFESMEGINASFYTLEYRYRMPDLDWAALQSLDSEVFDEALKEEITDYYAIDEDKLKTDPYKAGLYDRYEDLQIPGSYNHTLEWIESHGYGERLMPQAGSFEEVRLYKDYNFSGNGMDGKYYEANEKMMAYASTEEPWMTLEGESNPEAKPALAKITDQALIGQILQDNTYQPYFLAYGEAILSKEVYRLEFFNKDKNMVFSGYYYKGLPAFLESLAVSGS